MSKSLKNFISIDDYLSGRWMGREHSDQQRQSAAADLRMFFLQHKYHSSLHFSPERINEATGLRRKLESSLELSWSIAMDRGGVDIATRRMNSDSLSLLNRLDACKRNVKAALADDFDTPSALGHIIDLSGHLSQFVLQKVMTNKSQSVDPAPAVRTYVIEMMHIFGFQVIEDMQHEVSGDTLYCR